MVSRYTVDAMNLAQKGHFAPPPTLAPPHAQALSQSLAAWPGVHARTHWFLGDESTVDGADFYVGDDELGHLHLDGEAHVAVGEPLRNALVKARLARPFTWSRAFVTWPVSTAAERTHAEWLFSLRFAMLNGTPLDSVLARLPRAA